VARADAISLLALIDAFSVFAALLFALDAFAITFSAFSIFRLPFLLLLYCLPIGLGPREW
jgi:hypothetical protein